MTATEQHNPFSRPPLYPPNTLSPSLSSSCQPTNQFHSLTSSTSPPPPSTFLPTKQPPSLKPTSYQPSSPTHKHTGFCHSPRPPSAVIWSYAVRNLGKQESCLSVCNVSAAGGWVVGSCSKINNRIKVMLMIIMEQKKEEFLWILLSGILQRPFVVVDRTSLKLR